jgi:hypothetical protein
MEENATGNFQLKLTEQRRVAALGVAPRLGKETMGIPFHAHVEGTRPPVVLIR